jgi:FkbM family methyltransferase
MKKIKPSKVKDISSLESIPSIDEQQQLFTLYSQGLYDDTVKSAENLILRFPEHGFCWKILSAALHNLERYTEALDVAKKAVKFLPNDADVYGNLGAAFYEMNDIEAAEKNYRKALEINPNYSMALCNLASLLFFENRYAEAAKIQKQIILDPQHKLSLYELIATSQNICDWQAIKNYVEQLVASFESGNFYINHPFYFLALKNFNSQYFKKASILYCNNQYKNQLNQIPLIQKITNTHQKLRIGYISADFYAHATVLLITGVLENRNVENFEVYLYSYSIDSKDGFRSRVEKACEVFRDISKLSDAEAALQILNDEIDILIDLKGNTGNARLGIQALRPAPIVISWLGYPATLGHERLADYIIGDPTVTPLEHAEYYSETLALMPHCYQPNDNKRPIGVAPTRTEVGLPENTFVFCTFNQAYKITPDMFDIWCRLLDAVPNSVLWLLEPHPAAQENLCREIELRGIESSRLIFAPKMEQTAHLGRLQLADLAVDTFPYTSHTTASDALWAGVPLVTKMGETFASRVAASILKTMDLAELVTTNDEDYFNVALNLAQNPEKLAAIKQKIVEQKQISPLFDTQKFARDLERLYQTIWGQELKGERKAIVLTDVPQKEITTMNATLEEILKLERLTEIVDIGANPIDGDPPYKPMLSKALCNITGFEPQESALAELLKKKSKFERYLPYAVGDGNIHTLNICRASGMTSLFEPDTTTLELFDVLKPLAEVTQRIVLQTRKLDEIIEIEKLDFLKIDIQGGELLVFQNGVNKLADAVAIQIEVSFVTLYKNQPTIGEIDIELRRQGFIPHCFAAVKKWAISPCVVNNNPREPLNQLLEADIVYVRDFSKPEFMTDEQLKHLAMIVHYCYGSFDLALRCVMLLEQRNALPSGSQQAYLESLGRKA